MKVAFGMIVFNGNYVLKEVLETVYPYAFQILIAEGPVMFWQQQGYSTSMDGTNELIDNFPDPQNKIKIVHSQYSEKDEQCQAYMKFLNNDIDYLWNLDSDEIFKPADIEKLINILEREKYTSVGFKSISFYGGFNNYLTGFEERAEFRRIFKVYPGSYWRTHRPPTMVHRAKGVLPSKHLDFNSLVRQGIRMYHYSYVFPDQVYQKAKYIKECVGKLCHGIFDPKKKAAIIDNYFESVYLPWVRGDTARKRKIEKRYRGVHEFEPAKRGDCFPARFTGKHPKIIQDNMAKLARKFKRQLRKYG